MMQRLSLTNFSTFRDARSKQVRLLRLILAMLTAACVVNPTYAVDPNRVFSQYIRNYWQAENGFSGGQVNAFAQTPDGYLWIGTARGLYRFDGVNFVSAQQLDAAAPSITDVLGLTTDDEGNLWVRMKGSILRYRASTFEDVMSDLTAGSFVTAMNRASDGGVLLSNLMHGEILYGRKGFKSLASSKIFLTALVISIAQTSDAKVWIGTRSAGLFYINNGQIVSITEGLPDRKINSLLPMENGKLWIGTDNGIALWDGSAISKNYVPASLSHVQISALMRDRDGNVWVGTSRGLLRLNAKGVTLLQEPDKQSSRQITALLEDREGDIWIGGVDGIERLRDSPFVSYSVSEGLPSESNGPIYVDSDGRTWFGPSDRGLYWMRDGKVTPVPKDALNSDVVYSLTGGKDDLWIGRQQGGLTHFILKQGAIVAKTYTQANGLAQNSVYSVYENRDGTVWAGTLSGGVSHLKDGVFTTYTTADGLASNSVAAIEEGPDHTMWFATRGGLNVLSHGRLQTYTVRDGLPSEDVISLLNDSSGTLWIGTAAGLTTLTANKIHRLPALPESLHEPIFGLAEDKKGSLWIASSGHVLKVNRDRLLSGELKEGDIREYGLADGLHGTEGVRRDRSLVMDGHGRIWFSLNRGVSGIDPARVGDSLPAIRHIETAFANGAPVATQGLVRIPGPLPRIAFNYTGLSFAVPERIRFRYRLDGFDSGWSDATSARQAVYTNLGPGSYRFRVTSSNSDGLWSGPEAAFSFDIEPAFWQAWWFRISCVLTLAAIAWMLHRLRVQQVSRQMQSRLEERLEERERIARDLHDTMLQGFISASMQLDVANDRIPPDSPAKPLVARVLELMRQVSEEGRNAIRSLRSSRRESYPLEQALSRIGGEFIHEKQIDFRVILQGVPRSLHPAIWDEAYRIGREAVINAFRHSHASKLEVEVEYTSRSLRILVRDDGRGIDDQVLHAGREGHWGLSGMRERAEQIGATFGVLSRIGTGTEVELSIPGHIAFESDSSRRWPRWFTRLFSRKTEVDRPSIG
jgi:ligand-binding sensor domain-containing protein/signal transduction histidine kinase